MRKECIYESEVINQRSLCAELNDFNNEVNNPIITTDNSTDDEFALFNKKLDELEIRRKNGEDVSQEVKKFRQKFEKFKEKEHLTTPEETSLLSKVSALVKLDRLTESIGCKDITTHANNDMQPENFIERMLIDQASTTHTFALKLITDTENMRANEELTTDIMQKLISLSAKMFDVSQKAALALNKLRTAGTQTVIVKHQNVQVNGGQTVIANDLIPKRGANGKK